MIFLMFQEGTKDQKSFSSQVSIIAFQVSSDSLKDWLVTVYKGQTKVPSIRIHQIVKSQKQLLFEFGWKNRTVRDIPIKEFL